MKHSKSLLALVGLGALAYWRYKKATPAEKQKVRDVLDKAKDKLNNWGSELKSRAEDVKDSAKCAAAALEDEAGNLKEKAENTYEEAKQKINMGKMGDLPGTTQGNPTI